MVKLILKSAIGVLLFVLFSSSAWAAFPTVQARSTTTANAVTITVTLPTGSSNGDLIVILLQARSNTTTWTETAGTTGWTELYDANGQATYWKQIGAGEANPSFTLFTSERSGASALRITGHENPAIQAPQFSVVATGTSANPDPPNLTPTGGAKDYLWIAVEGNQGASTVTAAPTNYANLNTFDTGAGPNGASGATAERQLNAASEDPGAFTMGTSRTWAARTIAIHPAPATARRTFLTE